MLMSIQGRTHQVWGGIAIVQERLGVSRVWSHATEVTMRQMSAQQVRAYVATKEPLDKAGAYGIQGFAGTLIKRIEGSYSGVMGLPVFETAQLLSQVGIRVL
jgi:septum formation protein